jgi:octaprenyl-diphosphate synthase
VKNHNEDEEKVTWLIDKVNKSGGIDYAYQKMISYRDNAIRMLDELPDNSSRQTLVKLISFTIDRKK